VDGKDEDVSHRANRTMTAGARKTARRMRIASLYKFATHRSVCAVLGLLSGRLTETAPS
jgi:hypothetical protein